MGSRIMKNNEDISFPINGLDINKYSSEYMDTNGMYNLYGVIHHFGGSNGGHYVAYTKNHTNNIFHPRQRSYLR